MRTDRLGKLQTREMSVLDQECQPMTTKPWVGSHPTLTTIVVQSGASHRQANLSLKLFVGDELLIVESLFLLLVRAYILLALV